MLTKYIQAHRFLQVCICLFVSLWDKREKTHITSATRVKYRVQIQKKRQPLARVSNVTHAHSLRSLCSMRRWQYWKAFSLRRSFGGSKRLEEEVAETIETTDPSTSDRSSDNTGRSGRRGHDSKPAQKYSLYSCLGLVSKEEKPVIDEGWSFTIYWCLREQPHSDLKDLQQNYMIVTAVQKKNTSVI